ncbi:lysM domain protein [Lysobacter antibioticus]|uniref:LysM peptidoglycan-binding domain-containing protein n=1 Tax=Lysobacter antibioticus TaxID=84531 RepID=UPI0007174FCD|nr:LysM domain-containing protein [Lysobacter antibioticus]ALN65410.1 lysM domain protein [Lysobacter antibioticus]
MHLSASQLGYVPSVTPQTEPTTHQVAHGETLPAIADQYGVTPQALRAANPELFQDKWRLDEAQQSGRADPIFYGDTLRIPAAPMSVTAEPMESPYEASHGTSNSEFSAGMGSVKIAYNPGDNATKVTVTNEAAVEGSSRVGFKISTESSLEIGWVVKEGKTEFTVTGANVNKTHAEARSGQLEAEVSVGAGFRARYKVILPGGDHDPKEVAKINPFDPSTIPLGATVIMDGQYYTQTEIAGSFRHVGGESEIKDASGVSYSITRTGSNQVQIMKGPSASIEAYNGGGVRFKGAGGVEGSLTVGQQINVGDSMMRTATFDLDSAAGRSAYANFVATGEAEHGAPGVSDVATVHRLDVSSQGRLKLKLSAGEAEVEGDIALRASTTGTYTQTTYPDGSIALTSEFKYGNNVPLKVTQRFDAEGNEVRSERTYEYTVDTSGLGNHSAQQINWVLSGGASESGPAIPGEKVKLTFSEGEMRALNAQAEKAGDTYAPGNSIASLTDDGDGHSRSTFAFAVGLSRTSNQDKYGFANSLLEISYAADGHMSRGDFDRISMDVEKHNAK